MSQQLQTATGDAIVGDTRCVRCTITAVETNNDGETVVRLQPQARRFHPNNNMLPFDVRNGGDPAVLMSVPN